MGIAGTNRSLLGPEGGALDAVVAEVAAAGDEAVAGLGIDLVAAAV
jgi:hypothetical protein